MRAPNPASEAPRSEGMAPVSLEGTKEQIDVAKEMLQEAGCRVEEEVEDLGFRVHRLRV